MNRAVSAKKENQTPAGEPAAARPSVGPKRPRPLLHWALLALPTLAAFGPYLSFIPGRPQMPYLYRILVVTLVIPAFATFRRADWRSHVPPRLFLAFVAIWCIWSPWTILWTPDRAAGLRQVVGATICIIAALVVLVLSGASDEGTTTLRNGYTVAFVATGVVSIWELLSGSHLAALVGQPVRFRPRVITSTFYNPNNYAGFVLACSAALIVGAILARSVRARLAYLGLLALASIFVLMTNSRGAALGEATIVAVAIVWAVRKNASNHMKRLLTIAAVPVLIIGGVSLANPNGFLAARLLGPFEEPSNAASDQLRARLTELGIKYFFESKFRGTGAGSFVSVVTADPNARVIADTNPHNTFVEIAALYGIALALPFALLCLVLVAMAIGLRQRVRSTKKSSILRVQLGLSLIAMFAAGVTASTLLAEPTWWLLIGYATALAWRLSRELRASGQVTSSNFRKRIFPLRKRLNQGAR